MQSYLEPLAMVASIPASEDFSPAFKLKVIKVSNLILENFRKVVADIVKLRMLTNLPQIHLSKPTGNAEAVEPIIVATHRQLSNQHPLFRLLIPHIQG